MKSKIETKQIIDKLTRDTASGKLHWSHIDWGIGGVFGKAKTLLKDCRIDLDNSFSCNACGHFGLVYKPLQENGGPPSLHLVVTPSEEANDFRLLNKGDELQQELAQLQIMIKKQHPSVDDFLNEFMLS